MLSPSAPFINPTPTKASPAVDFFPSRSTWVGVEVGSAILVGDWLPVDGHPKELFPA